MLQAKDSEKLFEFKGYFKSPTRAISNLLDYFGVFSAKSVIKGVFDKKTKGYGYVSLLQMLIMMPFFGAKNIHGSLKAHSRLFFDGQTDCLYDTLRNPGINWRLLLFNFAKKFIKVCKSSCVAATGTYFIADDTDLEKRTPYFEGLSRVFNHVIRKHVYAYKLLVLGYSDGKSFTPLDFSLHNEKGKKKNYGLTKQQRKGQYSKKREQSSHGAKRKKEMRARKGANLLKMLKRAVKHGIIAEYLLMDSWFLSEAIIDQVRKIKKGAIHIVAMCKMDKRKYVYNDKEYNANDLRKYLKQNAKRSKKIKAYYIEAAVDYKGHTLKLFFIRLSKRSKWRLMVSTDMDLSLTRAYRIYGNRWAIEVFFKECKQLLGLGKNQSRDFDSQIASTTISFIQYTILALSKRFDSYETIGGIFEKSSKCLTEQILIDKILVLLTEIIELLVEQLNIAIEIEETISRIIENAEIQNKISLIFSTPEDKGGRKLVA